MLLSLFACIGITTYAQELKENEPKGKAIVQVFGNFHSTFSSEVNSIGFELDRSYLGYEYNFGDGLTIKGVMDVGMSSDVDDYHRIAYIKNAMVSWNTGNLTLNAGLIPSNQFNFQEKFWGYRYIMRSFQDKYKFGSSTDLGISAAYKFSDWLTTDLIIVNGDGYKKIQSNQGLNYGIGMTLTPFEGFQMRLYSSINENGVKDDNDIVNMSLFAGYKNETFTVGAEYNHMFNDSYVEGADKSGYSLFASVNLPKNISLYTRFDDVTSSNEVGKLNDESAAIFGAQFKLGKYVKIAPNFRMSMPKSILKKNNYSAYISCYFGL